MTPASGKARSQLTQAISQLRRRIEASREIFIGRARAEAPVRNTRRLARDPKVPNLSLSLSLRFSDASESLARVIADSDGSRDKRRDPRQAHLAF